MDIVRLGHPCTGLWDLFSDLLLPDQEDYAFYVVGYHYCKHGLLFDRRHGFRHFRWIDYVGKKLFDC